MWEYLGNYCIFISTSTGCYIHVNVQNSIDLIKCKTSENWLNKCLDKCIYLAVNEFKWRYFLWYDDNNNNNNNNNNDIIILRHKARILHPSKAAACKRMLYVLIIAW
jgi:hypothetical protein